MRKSETQKSEEKTGSLSLHPIAWLSACYAAGILTAAFTGLPWIIFLAICIIGAFATAVHFRSRSASIILAAAFASAGAMSLQIEKCSVSPNRLKNLYDEKVFASNDPVEITGTLVGTPELTVGGFFLRMRVESAVYRGVKTEVSGDARLFVPVESGEVAAQYDALDLAHGTPLRVGCRLKRIDKFLNPGVANAKDLLDRQGVDATAIIKSPSQIQKLPYQTSFSLLAALYRWRQQMLVELKTQYSGPAAGVLIASLLGNGYQLDKPTSERFREGGTYHILVISGLQITFIGTIAVFFLSVFTRNRFLQFLLATAFLWSYSLAVGADTPVVRAAVMFTLLLLGRAIFRHASLLNSFGASSLALLVWSPSDLFDESFQLTFVCVGAMVIVAFPLAEKLRAIGEWRPAAETPVPPFVNEKLRAFCEILYWSESRWEFEQSQEIWSCRLFKSETAKKIERLQLQPLLRVAFESVLVSVVIQLWMTPFLILYFHRISIVGIFLNVWVGAVVAVESLAAVIGVLAAQLNAALAAPFVLAAEALNWLMLHAADPVIEAGWASVRIPNYPGNLKVIYLLYYLPVLYLAWLSFTWRPFSLESLNTGPGEDARRALRVRLAAAGTAAALIIVLFHPFSAPLASGRLKINYLDVGQGDSALVELPDGETLLVDGGGRPAVKPLYVEGDEKPEVFEPDTQPIGERVVSAYLWERGYSRVDYILATHGDADHIQGLCDVAKNFNVRMAFFGRMPPDNSEFAALDKILKKKGIPEKLLTRGDLLTFGEVQAEVLGPLSGEGASDNNHSVVLRLVYGTRKFVMTGDIEKETERDIVGSGLDLQSDVVKVAHHGSSTSSTDDFIRATGARLAVISVGLESPFKHPRADVVTRWKAAGAGVMTTGENGTITVSTDGEDLLLETFNQSQVFR
jgi:competence protein ComEC